MLAHWLGGEQVRGPREGVGSEAGKDTRILQELTSSLMTMDFPMWDFPWGWCTRAVDGSASEISSSWALKLWVRELHLIPLNMLRSIDNEE